MMVALIRGAVRCPVGADAMNRVPTVGGGVDSWGGGFAFVNEGVVGVWG